MNILPLCPVCGRFTTAYMRPCEFCLAEMTPLDSAEACSCCGIDLAGSGDPCPACRTETAAIDGIAALGSWSGVLREWLSMLKYGGDRRLADWLAESLRRVIEERWPGSTVVPVPPRRRRILHHGRDAVGILCAALHRKGIPIEKPLKRVGSQMQKSLGRKERLSASALNYALKRGACLKQKDYILLDDVSTTGSTLRICAGLLKQGGAVTVHGLVVCKD